MPSRVRGGRKLRVFLRKARSAKSRSKGVDVGFFKTARYSDGTYVASVAAWNEFGTDDGRVPERPFFRQAIEGADRVINPILKAGVDPQTMELDEQTASAVGAVMVGRIQASIRNLRVPENAEITVKGGWMRSKTGKPIFIKGKGSDNPLIDEGIMRQSVDYEVGDAGDE